MSEEFPGNTHSTPAKATPEDRVRKLIGEQTPEPDRKMRVEPIEVGEVIRRKKPLSKRLIETFLGGDAKTVFNYVVMEVMVPAAKEMVLDAFTQGMERTLYTEGRPASGRRPGTRGITGAPWTSYQSFSKPPGVVRGSDDRREVDRARRTRHDFDDVIFETRVRAEQVLDDLIEACSKYQSVTVADLYDLVQITSVFTDSKWGWTDLRGADITRVRNGYLLDLPKPEPLD